MARKFVTLTQKHFESLLQECLDAVSPDVQRAGVRYNNRDFLYKCLDVILHDRPSPSSPLSEVSEADPPGVNMDNSLEFQDEELLFQ